MKKIVILYIILEILAAISLGIFFTYILPFSDRGHLERSIINTFIAAFLGIITGIAIPGYFHSKKLGKKNKFLKAIGLSIVGMILFLILYFMQEFITSRYLPRYVNSVLLPFLFPVVGAVLGFNYVLRRKR